MRRRSRCMNKMKRTTTLTTFTSNISGFWCAQKHVPFVHKELLAKVVIHLHMGDTVRAEEALNPATDVQGWYASTECQAGSELVAAFQQNDPEEASRVLKEQVFSFLQIEV